MKTLIPYATRHGCLEKRATELGTGLHGEVEMANFKEAGAVDLADSEAIIIGRSIASLSKINEQAILDFARVLNG